MKIINYITTLINDVFRKGFFHLLSANFAIAFMAFGSQLLVVKFLNPIELGYIKTIQSYIAIATILGGAGLNTAVLKICSEDRSGGDRSNVLKKSLIYSVLPISFTMLIIYICASLNYLSPVSDINKWAIIYMVTLPAAALTSILIAYLQAINKIRLMAFMQTLIRIVGSVLLIVLTYYYTLTGYILSNIIIGYVGLAPLIYTIIKNTNKNTDTVNNDNILYYAKWSLMANLAYVINNNSDIIVLNYINIDRTEIGYYSLATIFILALSQVTSTVQSVATPYFSFKSNNKDEFIRVFNKYQKIMVVSSAIVTVVAMFIVPFIIKIAYGDKYTDSIMLFIILSLKYLVSSLYALVGVSILGLGKMKYNFYSLLYLVFVTYISSFFFIKHYGVVGAAVSQVISCLMLLPVMMFMFKKVLSQHFGVR